MNEKLQAEHGYRIMAYLLSGLIFYGGLGWLADMWLGTNFLTPLGIILGMGMGVYLVIKLHAVPPTPRTKDDPDVNPDGKEGR